MDLGIVEDFSINIELDKELSDLSIDGLYLNSGVHPNVTIKNLLSFLPFIDIDIDGWDEEKEYNVYSETRKTQDIVTLDGIIYQSIKSPNIGQSPTDVDSEYWMITNMDCLKIKSFISKVKDRVYTDLRLNKRLINNQFIYEVGKSEVALSGDYSAWVFEPKGSDYVKIRINQISFQKNSITPVNLYVLNQGVLIDTLEITPSNGIVSFKDLNYEFIGKGEWKFVIDSTSVLTNNGIIDPLQYDGFTCYTETGIGNNPETATYSKSVVGNGLGFNISVYLDSKTYIDNNIGELSELIRSTFELMSLELFLYNSERRSNAASKSSFNEQTLLAETKSLEGNTVFRKYDRALKDAKVIIRKTFDTQLYLGDSLEVEITSN